MKVTISILVFSLGMAAFGREPIHTRRAMVVAQEPLAVDIGVRVLKAGGNAVDAAVAVGFALAVTYPYAGNLGGGGFLLVRMGDGRTAFLDFRECAPLAATRNMYLGANGKLTEDSTTGWRSAGVPGTVSGLALAHRRFGSKPWQELVQPAVDLAANGFALSFTEARQIENQRKLLEESPESKSIFLHGGKLFQAGDRLVQTELASTLALVRDQGPAGFYQGKTAHLLTDAMRDHGGLISLDDLKRYKTVEREPLKGYYRGYDILTAPPPSSGGIGILQMLAMLEGSGYEKSGAGSAGTYHYLAEVMRRFYADRSNLGDPDFARNPTDRLLDPAYIRLRAASIQPDRASPGIEPAVDAAVAAEGSDTTHFDVVDSAGNAVAVTYTLNGGFGNGITVPGAGFLLNNEMDDFAAKPGSPNMFGLVQGEANAIQPGKRPLSSMTPTIVTRNGRLFLVLGAPGGGRIINGVLQVLVNTIDFDMNIQDAVDWPRVHHQWKPDVLSVEPGVSPDTITILRRMGYTVERSGSVALVQAIEFSGGWLQGATDGRASTGKAAGY